MLKLASLGMFSFSLGQTVLCLGRNKTSCESFGYNACDYQVAGGSLQACPSCPRPSPVSPLGESALHSSRGHCSQHAGQGGSPCWGGRRGVPAQLFPWRLPF